MKHKRNNNVLQLYSCRFAMLIGLIASFVLLPFISTLYSSDNTPNIYSTPNEFGTICKVEDSGNLVYDYGIHPYGQLLTNEVVSSPWMNWTLTHSHGQYQRENGWSLSVDNTRKGNQSWSYNNNGQISRIECTNSSGRSIEITYNYLGYFPYYGINGDILGYVNENGSVVASYTYGPFGELASTAGSMADSFQFRLMTKRYDNALKLYDFGDRWYSIALRRWISRDQLGEDGGINLYTFCENDPVNKFDPNGCIPLETIWDIGNIIYDICVGDEVALAADTAALFVPYGPAGTTKLVKAARLSKVEKICPGAKNLEVTYKYNPYGNNHFQFQNSSPPVTKNWKNAGWVLFTKNHKAQFRPGFTHQDAKNLVDKALQEAKLRGKIRPSELDKYIFDAGTNIGAHNGKPTSLIQLKVTPQGEIHIHPVSR